MPRKAHTKAALQRPPLGDITVFEPRSYQCPAMAAARIDLQTKLMSMRHILLEWPRRSGKTRMAIFGIALPSMVLRPGNYIHILPTYSQGEKVVWKGTVTEGGIGKPILEMFPPHWSPNAIGGEMMVELHIPPGPRLVRYQVVGADDEKTVSRLVGTNPYGIIYDEAAQMTPDVRAYLAPALAENNGWELLVSTPRGNNWFAKLRKAAAGMPERWFAQRLIYQDCRRDAPGEDGSLIITAEEIQRQIADGTMSVEKAAQEYECSEEGTMEGAIFGEPLRQARREGRITTLTRDVNLPVGVCLDIGHSDATAIWFYQMVRDEVRFLDFYMARGKKMDDVARMLRQDKPYLYGRMVLPWDAASETFSSTEGTPYQYFEAQRFPRVTVPEEKLRVEAGNDMVARAFTKFVFHAPLCDAEQPGGFPSGLECLAMYRYKRLGETLEYSKEPVHDIYCHGADALRNGVMGGLGPLEFEEPMRPEDRMSRMQYNPLVSLRDRRPDRQERDQYARMGGR